MNKQRKAIETMKLIELISEKRALNLSFNPRGYVDVVFNSDYADLKRFLIVDLYDHLKDVYYTRCKPELSESIELELDEETLEKLYQQSDERDVLADDYLVEILQSYISELTDLDDEIRIKEEELSELRVKRKAYCSE